jgi:HEAT repeat protein
MSVIASDPIRTLLASDDPVKLRQGLALVREEIARVGSHEARPHFELVATLFYIDPLDRPDLLPVLDEAVDLVVGFGEWVIPALVEKLDAGDVKAQIAVGHALGRIGADAIRPLIEEYAVAIDDSHRAFILYALGKIRSPKVVAAAKLALEGAASPDLEVRDTATRVLGRFAESIPPPEMPEGLRLEFLARLEANLADRNTGVRAKAIRSLGKMARQGHLRPTERDAFRKACHLIVGDDEAFDWDRAFVIRREAEEALRYF